MIFDSLIKSSDPVISAALNRVLDGKDIEVNQAVELLDAQGSDVLLISLVADNLRKQKVGDIVTYVINRNINFTNVCIKRCGFCAFSRDFRQEEGYFLPVEEIVRRAQEAWNMGAREVCIQAGLAPKMEGDLYIKICAAIKKALPDIHIHAFSPEEILYGATRSNRSVDEYLDLLKEAGIGSLPGTSAEILDQKLRDIISPGRISASDWQSIIMKAHRKGIPTTSTIMFGHIESSLHKAEHLATIREIQKQTGGFTEFVPLSFVHSEAPMYNKNMLEGIKNGPDGMEVLKMHAVSRIMLNNYIDNIQVSWVKEGPRMSQILLTAGVNDFGGTLINESISTSAGSQYGQLMKPSQIRSVIRQAGRIPAERSTTYKLVKVFDRKDGPSKDTIDNDLNLETVNPEIFGSYHELIKIDKFKYKKAEKL